MPQIVRVGSIVCLGQDSLNQVSNQNYTNAARVVIPNMSRKSIGNFPFTLGTFHEKIIRVNGEEEDNKATEDLVSLLNTALRKP